MNKDAQNIESDNHPIPIDLIGNIDMISTKKNDDIDLIIIVSGYLNDSEYTEKRILQKVNNYLHFINSSSFHEEFGIPCATKVNIILKCSKIPHANVYELIHSIQEQVNSYNASIKIEA